MATLYLMEQGSTLRKTGHRLIVEKDDHILLEVQTFKIDSICVYGNVQITTQALAELLEQGIETALFTINGRLKGQLTPMKPKNIILRMKQYEKSKEHEFCLNFAKAVVRSKIRGGLDLIRRYKYNHPEIDFPQQEQTLQNTLGSLESIQTLESLRGVEGNATRAYFEAYGQAFSRDLGFSHRNRRPPKDPVNALLSFGYILITNEIHALLDGIGFDPYIGFYHGIDYGRPSLALDLVEEFRHPLVDRFVLYLINNRILQQHDFQSGEDGGIFLTPDSQKTFDIVDDKARNRVAKILKDYGNRVQFSVFEALISPEQLQRLKERVSREINQQLDSVRIYRLCHECEGTIDILGTGEVSHDEETYIV